MYPRNAASPEPIAIGPVVQISDGAVQTAGVTVRIKPVGVAEADGAGTTAYSTDGVVLYTPTQAETNYTSFVLIAKKTGCIPASVTVVTTASATAGYAGVDWGKITSATSTVNLSGTTISTSQAITSVSGSVGSVTGAVGSVTAGVTVTTNNDKTGYSLTQTFPSNFASLGINSSGHVSRVTLVDTCTTNTDMRGTDNAALASEWTATRAGYLDGVLIAANYNQRTVSVTGSNHVAADIHELQPAVITDAAFAAGWLTAAGIASDAVTELQAGLATAANLLICNDRVAYALTALVGACSDAQTGAETYTLSINGSTFTVDYAGLDASGNRGTTTLSKV